MRVYKSRWFHRFARKERIADEALLDAIDRAEKGQIDAGLGGEVIKQRIARAGEGRSKGYRTIILFRRGDKAFFVFGFSKSQRANIEAAEREQFKQAAKHVLALKETELSELVTRGDFIEVKE